MVSFISKAGRLSGSELKSSGLTPAKIWNLDELLPEAELGEKYLIHFKL